MKGKKNRHPSKIAAKIICGALVCLLAVPAVTSQDAYARHRSGRTRTTTTTTTKTSTAASSTSIAADGTYSATLKTYKYKYGKLDDTYSGTLKVTVKSGKISRLYYSGDKDDRIRESISASQSAFIGKTASVSVIEGTDAVASASVSTGTDAVSTASTSGSSSTNQTRKKKYYVIDLKTAIVNALKKAPASGKTSSGSSSSGSTTVNTAADGTYKGSASVTSETEGTLTITVNVTVKSGKITALSKVADETTGDWDSLLSTVSGEVVGTSAAASNIDSVSSATANGWKAAIQTAIKNALNGVKTSTGSGSSSSSGTSTSVTSKAVADGTYTATLKTYKYKHGKLDDTYKGTLKVTVKSGKIYSLSYSGDKSDRIRSSLKSAGKTYIGREASVSAIKGVDAVSTSSISTSTSTTSSSTSSKYYVMDLETALVNALSK